LTYPPHSLPHERPGQGDFDDSAEKLADEDPFAVGAGYLDAVRALAFTGPYLPVRFDSASPLVVRTETGFDLVRAEPLISSDEVTVYGETALWSDAALWSDTALWDD
jgi:hypothetical protein